MTNFFNL